jgi:hypothetical protein
MTTTRTYPDVARTYAQGIRVFFAGGPAAGDERAGIGPVSVSELTGRAETLVPLSAELTTAASAQLTAQDPALRLQASVGLLAKALTDLQVSKTLFDAAKETKRKPPRGRSIEEVERSATVTRPADLDDTLRLLLGEEVKGPEQVERGDELPKTVEAARAQLVGNTETTLTLIRDRAASTGWEALGGVAGIGAGKLAQAAGLVGMEVAEALGQADKLTRLYELVRGFLGQAIGSIKALLGPTLAQTVGDQAVGWIKDAATGKKFTQLVEKLCQTEPTAAALAKLAKESPVDREKFVAAIQGVDALEAAYRKQIELVGKILKVMKYVKLVPAAALPQGQLVLAAVYILVGGYVVLAGGDYVDAQNLKLLDRVPGVRKVVETNLASS